MRHTRTYHAPGGLGALAAGPLVPEERLMNGPFAPDRVAPGEARDGEDRFREGPASWIGLR